MVEHQSFDAGQGRAQISQGFREFARLQEVPGIGAAGELVEVRADARELRHAERAGLDRRHGVELQLQDRRLLAQPTFRSGVTAVTTDVITRDKDGRFVSNLTKDDFVVLEDDVPQTITSFALVHGGRTFNMLTPVAAALVAAPEGIVLPSKRAVQDVAGRVLFIFVDDVHFEPEYTPHVRKLIQDISDNLLHDGDLVAMLSSGPSSIQTGLTYDRKLVVASASKIRGSGLNAADIFRNLETSQGPADVRNRAQMAFYTAYNLLADLEQVPNKRKALLYISTGYDFDPFAAGRNSSDRIMGCLLYTSDAADE